MKAEQLEAAREELASTRAQLAECRSQVEGFAARFERIKAELAQIAECLSVRGFLGSFKAKLVEFAAKPVCGQRFDLRLERPMNLFLEILRATAYLASTVRSVLYVYGWWKEYKQNG